MRWRIAEKMELKMKKIKRRSEEIPRWVTTPAWLDTILTHANDATTEATRIDDENFTTFT